MWKNYFVIALRHLLKDKTYTAINVLGLGVALALCIMAYVTYDYDARYDAFHVNGASIYRINSVREVAGSEQRWGLTPVPLAEALARDVPGVEQATRLRQKRAVVRAQDRVFNERLTFVDPAFLDLFTFPLERGDPDVLRHHDQLVLSHEAAIKYFGEEDPLGRQLAVDFGNGQERVLTVGGVAAPYPPNSSIHFDFLAPYEVLLSALDITPGDWGAWAQLTFVEVPDPSRVSELDRLLDRYVDVQNAARPDWRNVRFYAEPLRLLAPHSRTTQGHELVSNLPRSAVVGSITMALLVLVMACFNFVNLSVVAAGRRLKEIGVRKVMGGQRRQLVGQFLAENLLLCLLALIVALGVAEMLLPLYDDLWPFMSLGHHHAPAVPLLLFLGGLVLATGLTAGVYPAYYASTFSPTQILRGAQRLAAARPFTRVLLGFQISLTIVSVAGSLLFAQNARYQEQLDLGYARDRIMVVPLDEAATFVPYRDALARNPAIHQTAGTSGHVGYARYPATIQHADNEHEVWFYDVGQHYVETAGLEMVQGRSFDPERAADHTTALLVNEALVQAMGWHDPIGQFVTQDSIRYTVVGVIRDFHTNGMWHEIEPAALRLVPPEAYRYLVAQVAPEDLPDVTRFLELTWKDIVPDVPYTGFAQDELLAESVQVSQSVRKMFAFVAIITLLIAGTGLFALVSLNLARRTKEIGIRKVLGATAWHIGRLVNREYLLLIGAAGVVAGISGYFWIDALLSSIYAYHVAVGATPFVMATAFILLLALLAVGGKVYRATTADPVHALRSE